jgi:hypothetical protein
VVHDLNADPLELEPLAPAAVPDEALAALRAALEHPAARATADPATAPAGEPTATPDELAALEERMRMLGYM